ncbi:hypothetical protein HDU79_004819 [Rhizoclosmatium sp. JEL0117]|nr:hypothetical protein HDU79_004819 [Rhizoclosmatium sp. JEL0117]
MAPPQDMVLGNIILGGLPTLTHHSNPNFKSFRKLVQLSLSRSALAKQSAVLEAETFVFLKSLVNQLGAKHADFNSDLKSQLDRFNFSVILLICFGLSIDHVGDNACATFLENTDKVFELAGAATDKCAFFPWLKWLPNAHINEAKRVRQTGNALIERLMKMSREKYGKVDEKLDTDDNHGASIMELIIHNPSLASTVSPSALRDMLNNLTAGAVDTVSIAIQWTLAFLISHPSLQQKIHNELDATIGRDRLPTLADEPNLPYLCAFIRESQRLRPVSATAVPRVTLTPQKWNNFDIPAGTWVMFDFYGLNRDTYSYGADVDTFRPERYLDPTQTTFHDDRDSFYKSGTTSGGSNHPREFSFGRRVCPGKELALVQLFLGVAGICQCFSVGGEVDLEDVRPGLTNPPRKLKVELRERFDGARELLL